MDVKNIITLMATLSIGLDEPSDSDIPVFLSFLNLAYKDILQETLVQNPTVPFISQTLTCTNGVLADTQYEPFIVRKVWDVVSNTPLKSTNLDKIEEIDPSISQTGGAQEWYYAGGKINIYPLFTGQIGIRYVKEPSDLKMTDSSSEILIPKVFQTILVDGAAYYLFQSETGFKDTLKMAESKYRWEKGRIKLFNYLKNLGGQYSYSTYSAV